MMTVRQMRIRAKSHNLTGYSRMNKAELITLLDSIRHQVGDKVVRAIDNKPGTIVAVVESTFQGIHDSIVEVQYDGETREEGTAGAHHSMIFVSRLEKPGTVSPLDFPAVNGETVTEAHVKFCAANDHATHKVDGLVSPNCARCGEAFVIMHPKRDGHGYITLDNGNIRCAASHELLADANHCAFNASWEIAVQANKFVESMDDIDQRLMVDVLRKVVDGGDESMTSVLDMIDAAKCSAPTGWETKIVRNEHCPVCETSCYPCDECTLEFIVSLYKITRPVRLPVDLSEMDCNA